jgi:hypothetical protein
VFYSAGSVDISFHGITSTLQSAVILSHNGNENWITGFDIVVVVVADAAAAVVAVAVVNSKHFLLPSWLALRVFCQDIKEKTWTELNWIEFLRRKII